MAIGWLLKMLDVRIKSLLEGAKQARGITVIVDVFRAGTNISLVLAKGAERIIPLADLEKSLALVVSHPEYIFMGERDGTKVPEFDYGNSPSEMDRQHLPHLKDNDPRKAYAADFTGKTASINTTSGTQGIVYATQADQILIGGFANSLVVENYIKREAQRLYDGRNPVPVTIVPIGWAGESKAFEDEAYAEYLQDRLLGRNPLFERVKQEILKSQFTQRFFDTDDLDFPLADLEYCLTLERFNNVPRVYKTGESIEIRDANSYNPNSS